MAIAHADEPYAVLRQHLRGKLDQRVGPRVVGERVMLGARDQDGVDVGQRRVSRRVLLDLPLGDLEGCVRINEGRVVECAGTPLEQVLEDTAVASETLFGVGQRDVAFEDADAEGRFGHRTVVWSGLDSSCCYRWDADGSGFKVAWAQDATSKCDPAAGGLPRIGG